MKKLLFICLANLVAIILVYLCWSFVNWSFSPKDWSGGGRFLMCSCTIVVGLILSGLTKYEFLNKQENKKGGHF